MQLSGVRDTPRLLDFGFSMSTGDFWLVMEQCDMSLRQWREGQDAAAASSSSSAVRGYLALFRRVASALCGLAGHGIIHFDLKCENVLLRRDGSVAISDLGEACVVEATSLASGVRLQRARGTECVQSPEMLLLYGFEAGDDDDTGAPPEDEGDEAAARPRPRALERRIGREYLTSASDVWSLGCLLYELALGDFLFNVTAEEGGWSRLFLLLTREENDLFLPRKLEALRGLAHAPALEALLRDTLVRNPDDRPSPQSALGLVDATIARLDQSAGAPFDQSAAASPLAPSVTAETSLAGDGVEDPGGGSPRLDSIEARVHVWYHSPAILVAHTGAQGRRFALPHAWADSALVLEEASRNEGAPSSEGSSRGDLLNLGRSLGVTHLLTVTATPSRSTLVALDECATCGTLCGGLTELQVDSGLSPGALDAAVAFVDEAVRAGGRVLIAPVESPGAPASETPNDLNTGASALALATELGAFRSLHDAALAARSAHATLRISTPALSKLAAWQALRAASLPCT